MTARRRTVPWVVKVGGSLAASPALQHWLDVIATGGGRLVVVPGGGPFADAVRAAQRRQPFDEVTAHRMAVLAMEQYANLLAGMCPRLQPAASRRALREALRAGAVPVWLPARMLNGRTDIVPSWDVTSDSLALWLAGLLRAGCSILVKSVPVTGACTATALARAQLVDRAFPDYYRRSGCACHILDADAYEELAQALHEGTPRGARVLPDGG